MSIDSTAGSENRPTGTASGVHDNRRPCVRCGAMHWRKSNLCFDCSEREILAAPTEPKNRRFEHDESTGQVGGGFTHRWCGKDVDDPDADAPADQEQSDGGAE